MDRRNCFLPQCEIKSALNLPEVLVLPGEQNEIMVSMNDYVTVSETDPDMLVTFGVTDCVSSLPCITRIMGDILSIYQEM